MNRYVVMVDAGYLLRQAIEIASKKQSHRRADLDITDPKGLIGLLLTVAQRALDLGNKELLRVYWYDGMMSSGMTTQQRVLVEVDDVQFRAGTVNGKGQQKGVDSLIVTDLIELTAHHAICDAVLITGDSDLAVGIELAQRRGVRIAVVGVEDLAVGVAHSQSFEITSKADRVGQIGGTELAPFVRYKAPAPAAAPAPVAAAVPVAAPAPAVPPAAAPAAATPTPAAAPTAAAATAAPAAAAPAPAAAKAPVAAPARPQPLTPADRAAITGMVADFIASSGAKASVVSPTTKRIESAVDRALIHHVFEKVGRRLTDPERNFAREVFRATVPA